MAEGVNKVILVGNLGRDPELSYTQSGTALCKFPVATSESYTNKSGERQDRTEWHNVVVWGKQGENIAKFLSKGRQVYVEGALRTSSWDDEKSGQKRYRTDVNAQKVVFIGGGQAGGQSGGGHHGGGPTGGAQSGGGGYQGGAASQGGSGAAGPGADVDFGNDDDIPF